MGWVDGKPRMVSERYLGSVADIVTAMDAAEAGMMPQRTGHLAFADWWATTAGDRFTRISGKVLDHRKFWDAMHAVDAEALQDISTRLAARMIEVFDLDTSSVALDMTNFATYIDTTNSRAPIAQRGKAKQKRTDLRLVGLGLVVTRAGGIPLVWHAYPGNRPDVTQFPALIDHLVQQYQALPVAALAADRPAGVGGGTGGPDPASMTVVFDAGQNSTANFEHLRRSGLQFVGSVPPSDCPDLLALPAADRIPVDNNRYPGVTAIDTHRVPARWPGTRCYLVHAVQFQIDQFPDPHAGRPGQQQGVGAEPVA
jgi:transposase